MSAEYMEKESRILMSAKYIEIDRMDIVDGNGKQNIAFPIVCKIDFSRI